MAGTSAGGIYLNTESGLNGFLDALTGKIDKSAQDREQLRGLAAGGIIPADQAPGGSIFDAIKGALGMGGPAQVSTGQTVPRATAALAPSPLDVRPQQQVAGTPSAGFESAVNQTLKFEGGLNPRDTNGTPSNFGINAKANPDVDVPNLTQDAAKGLYKTRYWDTIGADRLPPALQAAAFDTSVIAGPGRAAQFINQSGGDPQKFMDLREQFQNGLLQSDPEKYGKYAKAWANRNATLRAGLGGGDQPAMALAAAPGAVPPAMQAISDATAQPGVQRFGLNAGQPVTDGPVAPESAVNPSAYAAANGVTPAAATPPAAPASGPAPGPSTANAAGPSAPVAPVQMAQADDPYASVNIPALIRNPATRAYGLQLWQQKLSPKDGFTLKQGEQRFDARGRPIAAVAPEGPKPTDVQKNYQAAVAAGYKGSIMEYQTELRKAGVNTTNVNVDKGENAFDSATGTAQAKRFDEIASAGTTARQMLSDVDALRDLGGRIGTGKGAEVRAALGPYAEALGVKIEGLPDIQAYEAILNRVAPSLRVAGSGAQSDFELKNFLKSLPSLGATPEGNELIGQTMKGLYENKLRAAEIAASAMDKKITRAEAEKQLRELPDAMEGYRKFQKTRGAPNSGAQNAPDRSALEAEARRRGLLK